MKRYKKIRTVSDIKRDPRILDLKKDFDRKGNHMVECKDGFKFESFGSTMEFGTIKEICIEINSHLFEV